MLNIVNNGLRFQDGDLHYTYFEIEKAGRRFFRCVAIRELLTIPASEKEDYELLSKQHVAVRGLHNAGINFVYAAMGIYDPDHVGIVQYFGAAGEGASEADAARIALKGAATVEAVLSNYPQTKLGSPNKDWLQWYLDFITSRGRNIAAILGHPDPRSGRMGLSSDGTINEDSDSDLSVEQNESLFRGLSKLRKNFVFQVLAEHETRQKMTQVLMRVAQAASNVASRRKGSMGIGFSLGIPLMAALSQNQSVTAGHTQSQSQSVSNGVSQGWGTSHAVGQSHSVGNSSSVGTSQSVGQSQGVSQGQSKGIGQTDTNGSSSGGSDTVGGGYSEPAGGGLGDVVSGIFNSVKSGNLGNVGAEIKNFANGTGISIDPGGVGITRGAETLSGFSSHSSFHSSSHSTSTSQSESVSQSTSDSVMQSQSVSQATPAAKAVTASQTNNPSSAPPVAKAKLAPRSVPAAVRPATAQPNQPAAASNQKPAPARGGSTKALTDEIP